MPGIALNCRPRIPVVGCVHPEPQNVALFGGAVADVISEGSVDEIILEEVGLEPMTGALVRGGKDTPSGEDGRREWRDAATSQGQLAPQKLKGRDLSQDPKESMALPTPRFRTSGFKNWVRINLDCFKPLILR